MSTWLALAAASFGALFPVVNPFSTAPVFAALTTRFTPERRKQQAKMACVYMIWILLVSLACGALVMTFFGITVPALRIAGGLVVARIGFSMLNPSPRKALPDESAAEAMSMDDIAFTPIALPLLSGPGSIAVTISLAGEASRLGDYVAVAIGIVLVGICSWLVLRSSARIEKFLGITGMNVLTRLMGLILVCIGVQFIFRGVIEGIIYPPVVDSLLRLYGS